MYLHEVELENFRSFRGKHKLSLQLANGGYAGWTVFTGTVGAGKASLLNAIALATTGPDLLREVTRYLPSAGEHDSLQPSSVQCMYVSADEEQTERHSKAYKDGAHDEEHYRHTMTFRPSQRTQDGRPAPDQFEQWRVKGGFLLGISSQTRLEADYVYHNWNVPTVCLAGRSEPRRLWLLSRPWTWWQYREWRENTRRIDQHSTKLQTVTERASAVLDVVLGKGTPNDESQVLGLVARSEDLVVTRNNTEIDPWELSASELYVVTLALNLAFFAVEPDWRPSRNGDDHIRFTRRGTVLIERPERHLDVVLQRQLGPALCRLFPNIQFIVTTNSPFLCQAGSPGGLVRLWRDSESTDDPYRADQREINDYDSRRFTKLNKHACRMVATGSLDEVLTSDLFGLPYSHSDASESLRNELAELQGKLLTGMEITADERFRLDQLRSELPTDSAFGVELQFRTALRMRSK